MTRDAFVLGGGGVRGAAEVGMARALLEAGVRPDLVCGTSVGAINGAAAVRDFSCPMVSGDRRFRCVAFGYTPIGLPAGLWSRFSAAVLVGPGAGG
jgi:hypothetical protein